MAYERRLPRGASGRDPGGGGTDQPSAVAAVLRVDVDAVRERQLEQAQVVPDLAGGDQVGALLALVLDVHLRLGRDQAAGDLGMIAVGGGDERGRAAGVAGVDISVAFQQRPHAIDVARPRRHDQLAVRVRRRLRRFASAPGAQQREEHQDGDREPGTRSAPDSSARSRRGRCGRMPLEHVARQDTTGPAESR
jgi:hypothetical protein